MWKTAALFLVASVAAASTAYETKTIRLDIAVPDATVYLIDGAIELGYREYGVFLLYEYDPPLQYGTLEGVRKVLSTIKFWKVNCRTLADDLKAVVHRDRYGTFRLLDIRTINRHERVAEAVCTTLSIAT